MFLATTPIIAAPFDQKLYDAKARVFSPEESMAMMELQEGYRVELVAAEPLIEEPVAMAWDADGKLYVAELNTYMQEIDGKDQHEPICRVILLEDTDDDGRMDKRSVFVDKLVLPRMIQPLDDRVLIRETNTFDLHSYRDTDGDGVADEKRLVYEGGKRGGNLEHQPSGLEWNIDNWMYVTYTNKRYRWMGDNVVAEALPHGSGQWGVTHDDEGRNFFSTAGGENPAMDFQRPMIYGRISLAGEQDRSFREVFPLVQIPDVQGGHGRYRKDNLTLNSFTGCAGAHIYRGDALPEDFYGDYIIPEPVGRLVRRANVVNEAGRRIVRNATPGTEFLRSSDANFRPIDANTGPDGCLYLCDMYRGIIQEGSWVRPGSYLREVVENYGLDKNIKRGRIYRIVHESTKRGPKPQLFRASVGNLISHLSHSSGWWRDMAQKQLVMRQDQSAVAGLQRLVREGDVPLGRLHALWALEGLDGLNDEVLVGAIKDADPRVRSAGIRLCETQLLQGDRSLFILLESASDDADIEVAIQLALTLGRTGLDGFEAILANVRAKHEGNEALAKIMEIGRARLDDARRRAQATRFVAQGETNFQTICVACHAENGKGTLAPGLDGVALGAPLVGSPRLLGRKDLPIKILLKGMHGELDGKAYPGPMLPLESYDDAWLASVLTYVRQAWGNKASEVVPEDVANVRVSLKDRKEMFTAAEIVAMVPVSSAEMKRWTISASHNDGGCSQAVDGNAESRWDTGRVQRSGMWFGFDMGEPSVLSSVTLRCEKSPADFPRLYSVEASLDGRSWTEVVAKREGHDVVTDIILGAEPVQHVRIRQHGRANGKHWSIHQLEVYKGL